MKLIVGLGNPGKEYEKTRHNVGFLTLDQYLGAVSWKEKFNGLYYEMNIQGEKVIFLKPLTYMNLSGNCVREFVQFFKIPIAHVMIIQDDLDLPFLKYKLKYDSSDGGHNGIKSIIKNLGTSKIPRLKIGIAHDKSMDTKDYVLGSFSKKELDQFLMSTKTFFAILDLFITEGVDACMQKYNGLVIK